MKEPNETSVDINRASLLALTTIHGIGPGLAERIIDHRPYEKIEDLVRVPGINETKLLTLKPFVTVQAKKPTPAHRKTIPQPQLEGAAHMTKLGETETFVFLEDRNERQDALLIIFGGFILGLIILMLRRSNR
jgi:competence protein ComEA